ncbi:MAG: transposase [Acidobacteria bacterium]|nr:transposase [Acidobacteriota bacterium]
MPRPASATAARGGEPIPDVVAVVEAAVLDTFADLRRPVQRNLAVLTVAFLRVLGAARSGHGRLSLGALFRVLPTEGTAHAREKRLRRFLENPRLDPRGVTGGLARVIFGQRGAGVWPVVLDQTAAGSTQALVAGVPFAGRTLPLAVYTFDYPWREAAVDSQNQLERVFLLDVEAALPTGVTGVWIGDRGYARAALLRQAWLDQRRYVIRGRAGTCVEWAGKRRKLGELPPGVGHAIRYRHVLYQAHTRVPVDVIALHDPAFKEPWWLLVPPDSAAVLPTALVVQLYRERMQVEHTFRDFKTHLGLRGLDLRVHVAERTGRLLLAFCLAYVLAIALGSEPEAAPARRDLEILRRRPRHGTRRTLSVLSLAMQMLAHPRWRHRALTGLRRLIDRLARGLPVLRHPPPTLDDRLARA